MGMTLSLSNQYIHRDITIVILALALGPHEPIFGRSATENVLNH